MTSEIDGTVLNKNLEPLFQGSDKEIYNWIMENPVEPCYVWIVDESAPISIDEWMYEWESFYD